MPRLCCRLYSRCEICFLVHEKVNVSQHCVLAAQKPNCILDCIKTSLASVSRVVSLPLLCFHEAPPALSSEALKIWKKQTCSNGCREGPQRWSESWSISLKTGWDLCLVDEALGKLIAAFQYLQESYIKHGERLFIKQCNHRTGGNSSKFKKGVFMSDIRKKFIVWLARHWI